MFDAIAGGLFSPDEPARFAPLLASLAQRDRFYLLADFDAYEAAQAQVDAAYADRARWTRMAILNTARMGKFSSDRTISQYAKEIWKLDAVK